MSDPRMLQRAADFYGYPSPDNLPDGAYERWEQSFAGAGARLRFALDDAKASFGETHPGWWPSWLWWPGSTGKGDRTQ